MATRPLDPNAKPECRLYLSDLIEASASMTPLQFVVYLRGLQYEWTRDAEPTEEKWEQFGLIAGARNASLKKQIPTVVEEYTDHPMTIKMREQKEHKLTARRNQIAGQAKRHAEQSEHCSEVRSDTRSDDRLGDLSTNEINETAPNNAGEIRAPLPLPLKLSTHVDNLPTTTTRESFENPADHPGVKVVFEVFGRVPPIKGQEDIAATVTDLAVWRKVCQDWSTDYTDRPKPSKLLEIYRERLSRNDTEQQPQPARTGRKSANTVAAEQLAALTAAAFGSNSQPSPADSS